MDLSFGTAAQARKDALREADLALDTNSGTTLSTQQRLQERAIAYRRQAKKTRGLGLLTSLAGFASGISDIAKA